MSSAKSSSQRFQIYGGQTVDEPSVVSHSLSHQKSYLTDIPLNRSEANDSSSHSFSMRDGEPQHESWIRGFPSPVGTHLSYPFQIDPNIPRYPGLFPPPAVESDAKYQQAPEAPSVSSSDARRSVYGLERTMMDTTTYTSSLEKRKPTRSQLLENYKPRTKPASVPLRGGIPVATITLAGVGSSSNSKSDAKSKSASTKLSVSGGGIINTKK